MAVNTELNRLRRQCRRGMLELDLLLLEFLETHYPKLDERLQQSFIALLEFPDQSLHHCLIGADTEGEIDPSVKAIVKKIRAGGRNRGIPG